MKPRIHYTKPSITSLEVSFATDAAEHGWGAKCYEYLKKFEKGYADFLGTQFAIATSSCTGALHMGMHALGVGEGDEVILAETNWVASVSPVVHLKATPVFVDILEDTWCIDPQKIEKAITHRTKAIIATHIYGNLCDMDRLVEISKKYSIPIIEDSAEAIGSVYKGKRAGSIGAFGTFSFHGTKTLTTGEGGVFVTNDQQLYERVLSLSNHGRSKNQSKQFWPDLIGFKYKMSNIQAAIGYAQIQRIEELISRKREILDNYRKELGDLAGVSLNPFQADIINGGWMPTAVFDQSTGITRERLQQVFQNENIDARVFFWPLSSLDMFEDKPENKVAWSIPERAINLPSYHDMTDEDQERVVSVIKNILTSSL